MLEISIEETKKRHLKIVVPCVADLGAEQTDNYQNLAGTS